MCHAPVLANKNRKKMLSNNATAKKLSANRIEMLYKKNCPFQRPSSFQAAAAKICYKKTHIFLCTIKTKIVCNKRTQPKDKRHERSKLNEYAKKEHCKKADGIFKVTEKQSKAKYKKKSYRQQWRWRHKHRTTEKSFDLGSLIYIRTCVCFFFCCC